MGAPRRWVVEVGRGRHGGRKRDTRTDPVEERSLVDTGEATACKAARDRFGTLERDRTYWLSMLLPDGRPHVRPLLGLWLDDAFYFVTGERTSKGMNLAGAPRPSSASPVSPAARKGEDRRLSPER